MAASLDFAVRGKPLISVRSAFVCSESYAGGGPGRNCEPDRSTHVRQVPIIGSIGSEPFQYPGPVGIGPLNTASEPSVLARSMTRAATRRPNASPDATSLGYCIPARSWACPSSIARLFSRSASSGNRYARTVDAAPATTACSEGYEGLLGTTTAVVSVESAMLGRVRL